MTLYGRSSRWAAALALGLAGLIGVGAATVLAAPARSAATEFELTFEGTWEWSDVYFFGPFRRRDVQVPGALLRGGNVRRRPAEQRGDDMAVHMRRRHRRPHGLDPGPRSFISLGRASTEAAATRASGAAYHCAAERYSAARATLRGRS